MKHVGLAMVFTSQIHHKETQIENRNEQIL